MSEKTGKNSGAITMLELDLSDLMMVADALSLASSTARFSYGKRAHSDRLDEICQKICNFLPIPKRAHRDGGYDWFDTIKAIQNCAFYDVFVIETKDRWLKGEPEYTLAVDADQKRFIISENNLSRDDAYGAIEPLLELFDQHAPTDAVRLTSISAEVVLSSVNDSYDFEKSRPSLQAAIDKLGEEHGFHARIRQASRTYRNKVGDEYPYSVVVAVPNHQHQLVSDVFAATTVQPVADAEETPPAPSM